jgi:hypothetical protein
MNATELITKLRNNGRSITVDGTFIDISPADDLSPEFVQQLKLSKTEILTELQRETRQQKVLAMLKENPDMHRATYADTHSDPYNVVLTIAVRNVATCEMLIPKDKYDSWQLLALTEQLGVQNVH